MLCTHQLVVSSFSKEIGLARTKRLSLRVHHDESLCEPTVDLLYTPTPHIMNARLTSVEGQRVMSILDDAIQKFGFISMLRKEVLSSVETHNTLGDDAAIFLVYHNAHIHANTYATRTQKRNSH